MSSGPLEVYVEAARLTIGGGVQVAVEQYRHLEQDARLRCTWRLSRRLADEIETAGMPMPARYEVAEPSFLPQAKQLRRMLASVRPQVVYTIFGPAHLPVGRVPHVCGFAGGWMMWPNNLAAQRMGRRELLRRRLGDRARQVLLRNAGFYVVETELARGRLLEITGLKDDRVRVASNTCSDFFRTWEPGGETPPALVRTSEDEATYLVLSSHYPHKNLEIVPAVAQALAARSDRPFRFVLTLEHDNPGWLAIAADAAARGVSGHVVSMGRVNLADCPGAYAAADALFLPTLLETFTASYPEAMQMRCPIVTTDLPFARDLCQDAALFYSPLDPASAAAQLVRLRDEDGLSDRLTTAGTRRLGDFMDSAERADAVVQFLEYAVTRG